MDGIDGYAGGIGLLASLSFSSFYFFFGDPQGGTILLVLASVLAGFMVFNYPKASIFMGDVGSACLGGLFSIVSLYLVLISGVSFVIPLMILSVFYIDALVTLVGRIYRRESFLEAHRSHFYQKLVRSGWSHQQVIWLEFLHMGCNSLFAWFYFSYVDLFSRFMIVLLFLLLFVVKFVFVQKRFDRLSA